MMHGSKIGKIVSMSAKLILYNVGRKHEFCRYKINPITKTIKS